MYSVCGYAQHHIFELVQENDHISVPYLKDLNLILNSFAVCEKTSCSFNIADHIEYCIFFQF